MERNDRQDVAVVKSKTATLTEYVPAELNLESIGYFSASVKRQYPGEGQKSKVVNLNNSSRVIEIVANPKYGFPNAQDLDYYRAFLKICDERAVPEIVQTGDKITIHPKLPVPIGFSTREVIRNSGRMESARERDEVRNWVKRCTSTSIEGGLYRAEARRLDREFGGPLFTRYVLTGEMLPDGQVAEMNFVWPNFWFYSNYFHRYFRPVDLNFHRSLERAIAKTLYPILDTGFYAAQGGVYAKRYTDLCNILSLVDRQQLSLVQRQLDPSHEELKGGEFLSAWEYSLDAQGKWTGIIRWWPGPKWFHDQKERLNRKGGRGEGEEQGQAIMQLFPPEHEEKQMLGPESGEAVALGYRSHGERVKEFFLKQGHPKVSRQKIAKGIEVLRDLESQGFSAEEVDLGLAWIIKNKDRLGGKVYSLGLLPEVIGQALEESNKLRIREERAQRGKLEEAKGRAAEEHRLGLTQVYEGLPQAEQDRLQEKARLNLLQQGIKKEFLLDAVVKGEILRLLENPDAELAL
jgi:hypothetical protein